MRRRHPTHDARPCRAGDLRLAKVSGQGANQTVYLTTTLRARSKCDAAGYPSLFVVTARGRVRMKAQRGGAFYGPPGDVHPGDEVHLGVSFTDACERRRYRPLLIGMRGGTIAVHRSINVACGGIGENPFGLPAYLPQLPPPDPLDAVIHAPITPHVGMLDYRVTLRNDSRRAVRLRPCPSYTEKAAAWPDPSTHRGQPSGLRALNRTAGRTTARPAREMRTGRAWNRATCVRSDGCCGTPGSGPARP